MGTDWFLIFNGDFYQLDLAPEEYLAEKNINLETNSNFRGEGKLSNNVITIVNIHTVDNIVDIRNQNGKPLWTEKEDLGHFIIDRRKCIGCQLCVAVCPTNAILMKYGFAEIDAGKCIDCGICINGIADYKGCPTYAISDNENKINKK
ncbi:MAG: 4Fe-4S binding protein [Candidatus Cloacimonetes bacterium]|nr:4Fe-4S binding protein [Candidatus Cloacimonadota bacterium]